MLRQGEVSFVLERVMLEDGEVSFQHEESLLMLARIS